MSTPEPMALYDGRSCLGLIEACPDGRFVAATEDGHVLGDFDSLEAARRALIERAQKTVEGGQ